VSAVADARDLIVVGGACAGYTAAIYAARAGLHPLVIEGFAAGGQLMTTSEIENYHGFPEGITGPELMARFRAQAERFGAEFVTDDATSVDLTVRPFRVEAGGATHTAHSLIAATGARARELGLPSERALQGCGVSYCAVCDAAFFRGQRVIVVGGGDTALEEAAYLARFASEVVLVHRRRELRGSHVMQAHALAQPNLGLLAPYVVEEVVGERAGRVTGVLLRNAETGETHVEAAGGLFVAIGHDPASELFRGQLHSDPLTGYLVTEPGSTRTNVAGVFACGDLQDPVYRQAVTAAGSGCAAALDAERWLTHSQALEEATHALL
jgi:thioredoxin reductase (NADPH)